MAKVAAKSSTREPKKKASPTTKTPSTTNKIEKACDEALEKLRSLGIDQQLQNDIEWCLGSYRADQNPVGLYGVAERALRVFQDEKAKKTKGVTAKMITDLEKAIQERQ
jgi:citrate lyase synthetase